MRSTRVRAVLLLLPLLVASPALHAGSPPVLARLAAGDVAPGLAVHARVAGDGGSEVALVVATREALAASGARHVVLDVDARGVPYALVSIRPGGTAPLELPAGRLLATVGRHAVARVSAADVARLHEAGLVVRRLPASPPGGRAPCGPLLRAPAAYDPVVAGLVASVTPEAASGLVARLSGEVPVTVGGSPYTLLTRYTYSGTPSERSVDWAVEQLTAYGLPAGTFAWWVAMGPSRNAVAEKRGAARPEEVVLVTAHLDDLPSMGRAPGADDDASGSAAVLLAAKALSTRVFERTVRFVLFTGEEQGSYGSFYYAAALADASEDVVAVLNLDMVAWDSDGDGAALLHTRTPSDPGYASDRGIADLFVNVASWYGLPLAPSVAADGLPYSDHGSFWEHGYPAVLAIEDDLEDFNPWYHSSGDLLANIHLPYFTAFVKAAVGTAAHLAVPLSPQGFHTLAPCRLVDTRAAPGPLAGPALPAGASRTFALASSPCGVPPSARAVALNVTAAAPPAAGYLTLHAGGSLLPSTSTLNFAAGRTRANNAILPVSADGTASLAVANAAPGPVDVLLDVTGWFE